MLKLCGDAACKPLEWNNLHSNFRNSESISVFKEKILKF